MAAPSSDNVDLDYNTWDHSALVARVQDLERQLRSHTTSIRPFLSSAPSVSANSQNSSVSASRRLKPFDPSRHSTRHIALKFAYLGQSYNGFEHANGNRTPLPTVEEVLWKALRRAKLIWPPSEERIEVQYGAATRMKRPVQISWEGCQYSKCGRTDRGVSAFGQVIGIRVRSNRSQTLTATVPKVTSDIGNGDQIAQDKALSTDEEQSAKNDTDDNFDDIKDELPYIAILNSILPSDIRVLAWCPHPPPDFDARFSCRERRYKYFFTNPAFAPTPGAIGLQDSQGRKAMQREGWLDIETMREAAQLLVGSHDFRNLSKIDPSKQMTNFTRRITYADIEVVHQQNGPVSFSKWDQRANSNLLTAAEKPTEKSSSSMSGPQTLSFTVHGNAFLWHQVRCMVSILLLIGQGLEKPSLISELLDTERNKCRPNYEMAVEVPLVLWDCVFPQSGSTAIEDGLDWIYAGDARSIGPLSNKGDTKFGLGGTVEEIWKLWRKRKIDEILCSTLLDLAVEQGDGSSRARSGFADPDSVKIRSQKAFEGRDGARYIGKYIPVMKKEKMKPVETQNTKWRDGQGARRQLRQSKAPLG